MPPVLALPVLALKGATVHFGGRPLFADLDLGIGRGDRVCLVGRNGSRQVDPAEGRWPASSSSTAASASCSRALRVGLSAAGAGFGGRRRLAEHRRWAASAAGAAASRRRRASIASALDGARAARRALRRRDPPRRPRPARWSASPTCCCWTSPPTISTCRPSNGSRSGWPGFRGALLVDQPRPRLPDAAIDRRCCGSTAAGCTPARRRAIAALRGLGSEQILAAEEARGRRAWTSGIATETHWLRRGVTARRKRNEGRLRRLHDAARAARRRIIAAQGRSELAGGAGAPSAAGW